LHAPTTQEIALNKRTFERIWDQTRQKYGVYLRVIECIPDGRFQQSPIPGMRTTAALVAHLSGAIVKEIAEGVARGEIRNPDPPEAATAAHLTTRAKALAYAKECWKAADTAVQEIGDEELAATVQTPWGMSFPGWVALNILGDEFLHHRGQLYAYARACGGTPPFLWSFGENAVEFRPKG
jgi:uncharacterized damage-inducible protein DinB